MELPNLTMAEWKESNQFKTVKSDLSSRRTSVANVSKYYTDYVDIMGMAENFRNSTVVTAVKEIKLDEICKSSDAPMRSCSLQDIIPENIDQSLERSEEIFTFDVEDLVPDDLSSQCSSLTQKRSLSSASVDSCGLQGQNPSTSPAEISPAYRFRLGNPNYERSVSSPEVKKNFDEIIIYDIFFLGFWFRYSTKLGSDPQPCSVQQFIQATIML